MDQVPPPSEELNWDENGLLPVIAQDHQSGEVLMLAWMNREALAQSLRRGEAVYWSRSRQRLWHKGESSGHVQKIHAVRTDCDRDCLLLQVEQQGLACHTGRRRCFYRQLQEQGWETTDPIVKTPEQIYLRGQGD